MEDENQVAIQWWRFVMSSIVSTFCVPICFASYKNGSDTMLATLFSGYYHVMGPKSSDEGSASSSSEGDLLRFLLVIVVPSVVNGGILSLYFILWGKGLLSCGPLIALLAEYAGALLGVLSAVFYGRKVHIGKKVGGLIAMLASYYFLSRGWATRSNSPFNGQGSEPYVGEKQAIGFQEMAVPITAGILSALRRVIARRISLKNQLKRRLHAITVVSATCFLFPLAMWDTILGSSPDSIVKFQLPSWAYLSTVLFGIVFIFYVDNVAEERLHLVFSSPRHIMAAGGCIILMEIAYNMDFSLIGFLICVSTLAFGIYEATSLERSKKGPDSELSDDTFQDQIFPLPS